MSRLVAEGPVDIERLLGLMGTATVVTELPRQPVRTVRFGVQVIVDLGEGMEPFLRDAMRVLERAAAISGRHGCDVLYFADCPLHRSGPGAAWTWGSYHPPATGTRVLVLSDFGLHLDAAGRLPPRYEEDWRHTAGLIRHNGCSPVALVPAPLDRWPRWLTDLICGALLGPDHHGRRRTVEAAMNTRHGRLPGQEPEPFRVEDLPQPARRLAVVLSTATRIEPELMRTARLELRPTLDVGAEATLWFGDWASRSGADHMALHHDLLIPLRGLLSAELAADPGKGAVRRTGAVISRAHRGLSPALALEEQVTWAAVLADAGLATDGGDDPDTAIDRMLERVLRAALEEPDRREGLRRWFAGAWQRFPERVRLAPGAQTLFDVLVQGGGPDASASGHPSPLRFEGSTDIVLTLRHDGAYITAGDPVWPVEGILVPDTHPRVLDVSSDPVNWSRAQKLRVPRHGTAAVDVSHVPVYVRNARGVIYQLGAPDSSATVRYGLPGAVPMQDDLDAEVAADNPADALVGSGRPPRIHEEATEHDSAGPASPEQPEQPEQFDQYEPTRSGVFLSPPYGQIATPSTEG